ncbi:MAG: 1-phosphofructokinase family hexose kinase [Defluviitaleaceae bacterium]|nr:1-phosphofructokinase family hexose kinase [Defluviitaleaceae bacterium]
MKIVTVTLNPCIDWQYSVQKYTHGGLNRICRTREDVAGKGINVAVALKNLGAEPICTGFNFAKNGALLAQKLDALEISHDFVEVPGEIRTNIKLYDESTGEMTELNQPGAFVAQEFQSALLQKIKTAAPDILVLSGSRPEGVPADFYAEIARVAGKTVFLDTEGDALRKAIATGKIFAIKPNLFEFEAVFGSLDKFQTSENSFVANAPEKPARASSENAQKDANEVHSPLPAISPVLKGVRCVCVSMGAAGAVMLTPNGRTFAPALDVEVRGVVGAGDAMVAGMVYAFMRGLPESEFLRYATAAAAASVTLDGTQMCIREGFEAMLAK